MSAFSVRPVRGDHVMCMNNNVWYPATIVKAEKARYLVQTLTQDKEAYPVEEWVPRDSNRLRSFYTSPEYSGRETDPNLFVEHGKDCERLFKQLQKAHDEDSPFYIPFEKELQQDVLQNAFATDGAHPHPADLATGLRQAMRVFSGQVTKIINPLN